MSYFRTFLAKPSKGSFLSAVFAHRSNIVERNIAYGNHSRQSLDVYRPSPDKGETVAIMFLHGGGWNSGEKEMYGFVGASLAARGFTTIIPNYRLFPDVTYPELMTDVAQAYYWTHKTFAGSGSNQYRLYIMGHSSGAHMGALLAYDAEYLTSIDNDLHAPDGFIGLSGPYGFDPTKHQRSKDIFADVEHTEKVQPIHQVRSGAPPAVLIHGKKDKTVLTLNAIRMAEALNAVGSTAQAIEYANVGHIDLILTLSKPFLHRAPVREAISQFVKLDGNTTST